MSPASSRSVVARGAFAASLIVGLLSASSAWAIDNPLDVVPEDAVAVLKFKKPKTTIDNTIKLAAAVNNSYSKSLLQKASGLGAMIHNPQGIGVDQKFDWYIIYLATESGSSNSGGSPIAGAGTGPAAAGGPAAGPGAARGAGYGGGYGTSAPLGLATGFAIAAAKMETMEPAVKQSLQNAKTLKHENWLLYSDSDAAITRIQECRAGKVKSLRDTIDAASKAVFDHTDLAIHFNVKHLTQETYRIELEATKAELDEVVKDPGSIVPSLKGVDLKPVFEGYAEILQAGWQAVNDCEAITVGFSVKAARGIDMELYARAAEGSPTADFLKSSTPSSMALLEKMPVGSLMYVGSHGDFPMLTRWGMTVARTFTNDEEARKALDGALDDHAQIQFGTTASAFTIGDSQDGLLRWVTASEMTPGEKARDMTRKTVAAYGKISFGQLNKSATLKEEAETVGDFKVDLLEITTSGESGLSGFQAELVKQIGGEDGSTKRIAYLPELVVQTEGGGPDAMKGALAALGAIKPAKSGETTSQKNGPMNVVRAQLTPNANFLLMIDLGGIVAEGVKAFLAELGSVVQLSEDQAKKLSSRRSYLGLSVAAEPSGVRVKTHVPLAQIQSLAKLEDIFAPFLPLLKGAGGAGAAGPAGAPDRRY